MAKCVQIPEELFIRLCYYHLVQETPEGKRLIEKGLDAKLDSMRRRELYGKALQGDEPSRQAYLDMIGMREGFRW